MTGSRKTANGSTGQRTTPATRAKAPKGSSIPRIPSVGEEYLAQHLTIYKIPFQREVCLIDGRKFRWDFWIPERDLAIEIQGGIWHKGAHSSGSGLLRDYRKANALTLRGGRCFYFTTQQVESGEAIDTVRAALGV